MLLCFSTASAPTQLFDPKKKGGEKSKSQKTNLMPVSFAYAPTETKEKQQEASFFFITPLVQFSLKVYVVAFCFVVSWPGNHFSRWTLQTRVPIRCCRPISAFGVSLTVCPLFFNKGERKG